MCTERNAPVTEDGQGVKVRCGSSVTQHVNGGTHIAPTIDRVQANVAGADGSEACRHTLPWAAAAKEGDVHAVLLVPVPRIAIVVVDLELRDGVLGDFVTCARKEKGEGRREKGEGRREKGEQRG